MRAAPSASRPPTLARDMRAELGRGRVGWVTRVRATGAHAGVGETEALCNRSTMQQKTPLKKPLKPI